MKQRAFITQFRSGLPRLVPSLVLILCTVNCSPTPSLTEPVDIRLAQISFNTDDQAIVSQLSVPNVAEVEDLAHVELLFMHLAESQAEKPVFAALLNFSDRVDPIPPGNFGVIIDPTSDDRSISNVDSAAGVPERWDQVGERGTLLKESNWMDDRDLVISFWVKPADWPPGKYRLQARSKKRKQLPTEWSTLTEFNYTGERIEAIDIAACLGRPVIIDLSEPDGRVIDQVSTITLISYAEEPQDEGVNIQRWPGDRGSEFKYVEIDRQDIRLEALEDGKLSLQPGLYQFKHNSVRGTPPSGYYGESRFFELRACDEVRRIEIGLYPAI